jgi:galactose-1-phosphate uridylyltransferase
MSSTVDVGSAQREDLTTNQEGAVGGSDEPVVEREVVEETADSDTEHHDLSSILAYLIRRYSSLKFIPSLFEYKPHFFPEFGDKRLGVWLIHRFGCLYIALFER